MLRPPPLRPGDVVRVVAPSSPIDAEALASGIAVLRDGFGFTVRCRDDVGSRAGYLAGDDARRLAEWREAAADLEAKAIFCARGGYGSMRILPRLEPARLLHPPKWVIGYSDATAIHAVLNRAGLVTVHGPMVYQLARLSPAARVHLGALLGGPRDAAAARPGGLPGPGEGCVGSAVVRPGRAVGTLLGGSLTMLASLCGTPFLPALAGAVLLLEDVGERPYKLDRYFTQLRLAGALAGVRAVCLGHLADCDEPGAPGGGAAVLRQLVAELGVPAIEGLPVGHADDNFALPLGGLVTVVAPERPEDGPPRLLFERGARSA